MAKPIQLLLSSFVFLFLVHASAFPQIIRQTTDHNSLLEEKNETLGNSCSYIVSIKTSCSSPRITRDAISLFFGDFYRNQVYAPRLDNPASGAFERCSTDDYRIWGPCGGKTCYLYLSRAGYDGWTPESVKVFYIPGDSRTFVSFYYNVPIPAGTWYGFDYCHGSGAALGSMPIL